MEKLGWFEFKAEGLSLERLLNQCAEHKVRLRRLRRVTAREVQGNVVAGDLHKLKEIAESRGWRLTVGRARGVVRFSALMKGRALLMAGVLAFFALCWGLLSCVWQIDVRGAGPYTGEVERILREHDVRIGRFTFLMDFERIKSDLEQQLTGLSWVNVSTSGVRLSVNCVQAQLAAGEAAASGDLVASRDGIIKTLEVFAGTPAVKVGDAVRKGQVLVRGQERAWDGAVSAIRAKAQVEARVWYTASAFISGTEVITTPTGETFTRHTLCMPYYELSLEDAPVFAEYDLSTEVLPIAGPMPIWMRLERYEAVKREQSTRDESEVMAEAGLAATRLAQEKTDVNSRVVDKWVEYSMIKDAGCRATAVLEAIEEIAVARDPIRTN